MLFSALQKALIMFFSALLSYGEAPKMPFSALLSYGAGPLGSLSSQPLIAAESLSEQARNGFKRHCKVQESV